MTLPSDASGDWQFHEATPEHVAAARDALEKLAHLASSSESRHGKPGRTIHVRLSHYEHGAFLSQHLYGFAVLPLRNPKIELPEVPALDTLGGVDFARHALEQWAPTAKADAMVQRFAAGLAPPQESSSAAPFTWAAVVNQPVAHQVERALAALGSLLGRQAIAPETAEDVAVLQRVATDSDAESIRSISEAIATRGWEAAAQSLRERAAGSGLHLKVTYEAPLFSRDALAARAPLLRQVYNDFPAVRVAIDKSCALTSQGMRLVGGGSEAALQEAQAAMERSSVRTFLAHVTRDAFVCGNGFLVLSLLGEGSLRLLEPESVLSIQGERVSYRLPSGEIATAEPVMHVSGGAQVGSDFGVSFVEPFVRLAQDRDVWLSTLLTCRVFQSADGVPTSALEWASRTAPIAERHLSEMDKTVDATLGGATVRLPPSPPSMYFPGFELMAPASERMTLFSPDSGTK